MATEGGLGDDISDIPAVGLAPEWMSEKALAIGLYCAASGAYVIFGHPLPGRRQRRMRDRHHERGLGENGRRQDGIRRRAGRDGAPHRSRTSTRSAPRWGCRPTTPDSFGRSGDARMRELEAAPARRASRRGTLRLQPAGESGGDRYVPLHCNPRHSRRKRACRPKPSGCSTQPWPKKAPDAPVAFPQHGLLPAVHPGHDRRARWKRSASCEPVLEHASALLHPVPSGRRWTPYLGETLDSGMATLLRRRGHRGGALHLRPAAGADARFPLAGGTSFTSPETPTAATARDGHLNGPIDDIQLRSWGIQLVDGRMPGFAAIVGCAKSNEVAVKIVRELQRRNILCFLSGNVNGRSIIHQLIEEGVELGYDTYTVPFGTDYDQRIYALGFAVRSALTFGGLKGGMARDILLYNKERVFAFVLALGRGPRPPEVRLRPPAHPRSTSASR